MYHVLGRKHIPVGKKAVTQWLDAVRLCKDLLAQLCNMTPGNRAPLLKTQQFVSSFCAAR